MKYSIGLSWIVQICRAFALLGCALLLVAILGHWGVGSGYRNYPARPGERFNPELANDTRSIPALLHAAQRRSATPLDQLQPAVAMDILYEVVADRFTHGDQARYNFMSNWLIWLLSQFSGELAHILHPDAILSYGHSALCDQVSYILICLAREIGIPCRHVAMEGHVFAEAWYDDAYHIYDPDLEIVPRDDAGRVLSRRRMIENPELAIRHYVSQAAPEARDNLANIILSRQKIAIEYLPPGPYLDRSGAIRYQIHRLARPLKFILPVCMILLGLGGATISLRMREWIDRHLAHATPREPLGAGITA